jgi:hypothetical protein
MQCEDQCQALPTYRRPHECGNLVIVSEVLCQGALPHLQNILNILKPNLFVTPDLNIKYVSAFWYGWMHVVMLLVGLSLRGILKTYHGVTPSSANGETRRNSSGIKIYMTEGDD